MSILDWGECEKDDDKHPAFPSWANMVRKVIGKPYSGKSICPEWKSFAGFRQWADLFWSPGKKLVLLPRETVYSPTTCVMVSGRAASVLLTLNAKPTDLPIGVTSLKIGKFVARGRDVNGKLHHLGTFAGSMDAHRAWQAHKVKTLREMAAIESDPSVAGALLACAINISADLHEGRETVSV